METTITEINFLSRTYDFLELEILSFNDQTLIVAASKDFSYYHNFEIHFKNVFAIIGNISWRANTKYDILKIMKGTNDAIELNKKFNIEEGFNIFSMITEDSVVNYIIAESILLRNEVVKYY